MGHFFPFGSGSGDPAGQNQCGSLWIRIRNTGLKYLWLFAVRAENSSKVKTRVKIIVWNLRRLWRSMEPVVPYSMNIDGEQKEKMLQSQQEIQLQICNFLFSLRMDSGSRQAKITHKKISCMKCWTRDLEAWESFTGS